MDCLGNIFAIELSLDIDQHAAEVVETPEETEFHLQGMRVMLVDDIDINIEVAKCMPEEAGVIVTCAEKKTASTP